MGEDQFFLDDESDVDAVGGCECVLDVWRFCDEEQRFGVMGMVYIDFFSWIGFILQGFL